MECGQVYTFTKPEQFWAGESPPPQRLDDLISVSPDSPLETLDYALRNYIAFASTFMDEFLSDPQALNHALLNFLEAPLFTSHRDRMTFNIIQSIASPSASSSTLFISLMLVLHLGDRETNPGSTTGHPLANSPAAATTGITVGSSKVFRMMRKLWGQVVPVLMKWVQDAGVVEDHHAAPADDEGHDDAAPVPRRLVDMPAEGWEERVGTAATAVLYEVCRVQKLSPEELAYFTFPFISHLFSLVERTRDAEDETFNYTLIKLLIALNEQFMVSALPVVPVGGESHLPPPILPTLPKGRDGDKDGRKRERGPNFVLEVLKEKGDTCKTFGENIIFILNRADGTPDSLCVSLLILKVLYLLFTTAGTQEFFYTNDLCVLVDVFIRELHDLGEESEGLKHTYLRVLHPLMTNTQLRHHPYKRPELRKILEQLIRPSLYREVDSTTRRLVERNLRGSWCAGLRAHEDRVMKEDRDRSRDVGGSTLSVDAVAVAEEGEPATGSSTTAMKRTRRPAPGRPVKLSHTALQTLSRRRRSLDDSASGSTDSSRAGSPMTQSLTTLSGSGIVRERQAVVDQVARAGPPELAKASFDGYDARVTDAADDDDAESRQVAAGVEAFASSPVHEDFLSSIPSISAGHSLLDPIAQRHVAASSSSSSYPRSTSASHPPLDCSTPRRTGSASSPPLVHPRPRSTSLSVHSTHAHQRSKHAFLHASSDDAPPLPPPSPLSTSASATFDHLASSTSRRRRPPPPPPSDLSASTANGTAIGASMSRSGTPQLPHAGSTASLVAAATSEREFDVEQRDDGPPPPVRTCESPKMGGGGGARRRAPPPPVPNPGGGGSPRSGVSNGLEGLRVS
ncbi:hypothetical protein JCM10212_002385 [Sporobolomyces blumeae]